MYEQNKKKMPVRQIFISGYPENGHDKFLSDYLLFTPKIKI
jgi:hypothetical protein